MIPESMYQPENWPIWAFAVTVALVYPVRQIVLIVLERWAAAKGRDVLDPRVKGDLKARAFMIALLLTGLFAALYTRSLFMS